MAEWQSDFATLPLCHFLLILKGGSDGSVLLTAILHGATDATIAYSNVMTGALRLSSHKERNIFRTKRIYAG